MKDMERWAKIQNQKKEIVRAASPVLKSGTDDDKKQSKSADAAFAVFERKVGKPISKKNMATTMMEPFILFIIFLETKRHALFCILRSRVQKIYLRSLLLLQRKKKSQR